MIGLTEIDSPQKIITEQLIQILKLTIATLETKRPEEFKQETLTQLIAASEHSTNSLRFLRTLNYEQQKGRD